MTRPAVETAFRSIAAAVDKVGEAEVPLFLAKLSLLLSNELNDAQRVRDCIDRALAGFEDPRTAGDGTAGSEGG